MISHTKSLILLAVVVGTGVLCAEKAIAHPLPNLRFDRNVKVRLGATGVLVQYQVELNDWTMVIDGKSLLTPEDIKDAGTSQSYARKYAERKAAILAEGLHSTLNNQSLTYRADTVEVTNVGDHLEFRFTFRADWPEMHAESCRFQFEDQNFEDRVGVLTLMLDTYGEGVELLDSDDPQRFRGMNPRDLKPGEETMLRKASATIRIPAKAGSAKVDTFNQNQGELSVRDSIEHPDLVTDVKSRGLHAILDSNIGLGALLLLSIGFGAAHAFTPGHGKTMVAAYLIGERGTVFHAIVLGIVTTLVHTGSVILLAITIYTIYGNEPPPNTQAILTVVGGLLIAFVGSWLFLKRVRGEADHVHLFQDQTHSHVSLEDKQIERGPRSTSWLRIALLGIGGGIIPCWDAVLLFLVALSRGKVGLAIPLLVAFSIGLAGILIILGIGVVHAHRFGGRRFAENRFFQWLPTISAAILTLLGLWLARDGVQIMLANESYN